MIRSSTRGKKNKSLFETLKLHVRIRRRKDKFFGLIAN
jgi:hypothetical protein